MQSGSIPVKFPVPFASGATSAYVRPIPVPSQIGTSPGAASFTDGFPPLTFDAIGAGGIPPDGRDVNGILNALTLWTQWLNAGGPINYDAAFSTAIGGYPSGAKLQAINPAAVIVGSISGTTLTVGSVTSGTIVIGQAVTGLSVIANTVITAGSGTSWTVSISQTVSSETLNLAAQNIYWLSLNDNNTTNPDAGGAGWEALEFLPGNAYPIMDGNATVGISNLLSRQDHIHPSDTSKASVSALGTAAYKNSSSTAPIVASVAAAPIVGHLAIFSDVNGTIEDGGAIQSVSYGVLVVNSTQNISPGFYFVDTSAGPITLTLTVAIAGAYTFVDAMKTWGTHNLTIAGNGNNINADSLAPNFVSSISGHRFSLVAQPTYWERVEDGYTYSGADGSASNKKVISGSYQILASDSGLILDPWSAAAGFVLTLPLAGTTAPSGFNLIIGPNPNGGSISNPSASTVDMYYPDGTVSHAGGGFTMPAGGGKAFRIYEFASSFRIETIGRTIVAPAVSSNEATAFSQVFGLGQTRNAVTASRATNTVYTNPSATKPMFVFVCISNVAGGTSNWINNGVSVVISGNATGASVNQTFSDIVLPGQTYELSTTTDGIISWSETY